MYIINLNFFGKLISSLFHNGINLISFSILIEYGSYEGFFENHTHARTHTHTRSISRYIHYVMHFFMIHTSYWFLRAFPSSESPLVWTILRLQGLMQIEISCIIKLPKSIFKKWEEYIANPLIDGMVYPQIDLEIWRVIWKYGTPIDLFLDGGM